MISKLRLIGLSVLFAAGLCVAEEERSDTAYSELVQLFQDWRDFEKPPLLNGAPDYTAERFAAAYAELPDYRARLAAIDISDWPVEKQVDWHIVRAEMNGFEFNYLVLQPWVRDPAFYQSIWTYKSDVPAHEGPTHHAVLELWTYDFPLSDTEERRLISDLNVIPPLMRQARINLTGNARDLWVATISREAGKSLSQNLKSTLAEAATATDKRSSRSAHLGG